MLTLNAEKLKELTDTKKGIKDGILFNKITLNNYSPSKKFLKGEEYIVVPTTIIVEGVLNYILYTKDEMWMSNSLWNGSPVVLNHPDDGMSANRVSIIENYGLGTLYNTAFEIKEDTNLGLLKTEVWFKPSELERIDPDLYQKVLNGDIVEVSTGLRVNLQYVEASFRGDDFYFVASNYKPDHLAILPKDIGACSVSDGCGLNQNKKEAQNIEISENLGYDNTEIDKQKENIVGKCNCPEKVKLLTDLSSLSENVVLQMNQEQIEELIAIYSNKVEDKKNEEEKLETEQESASEETENKAELEAPVENTEEGNKEASEPEKENKEGSEGPETKTVLETMSDLENTVSEELKKELNLYKDFYNKNKGELVNTIVSLPQNKFSETVLNAKSIEELEAIISIAQPVDYSLANSGLTNKGEKAQGKQVPLSTPKYNNK